jgi:Arc/MetJ-type ribon-helix-helix transcriptional regulator
LENKAKTKPLDPLNQYPLSKQSHLCQEEESAFRGSAESRAFRDSPAFLSYLRSLVGWQPRATRVEEKVVRSKFFCIMPRVTRSGEPCYKEAVVKSENGEPAMQLNVPPDLETLINKRLSSGGYTSVEDVLRRALEAQDAEESWTEEERRALSAHIEQGYLQAERGELIDGAQVRREIETMKDDWRLSKR